MSGFEREVLGLCEECARAEIRVASACYEREKAAKAKGESFVCTCPGTVCTHNGTEHKSEVDR